MSHQIKRSNPIFGLLRLIIVAAAGVGGWFAYDTYVVADVGEAAEVAEASSTSAVPSLGAPVAPWPADVVVADQVWPDGYVATWQPAGTAVRQQNEFDAASGRMKMTEFGPDGENARVFEVDADEVWADEGDGFVLVTDQGSIDPDSIRDWAFGLSALTLEDALDPVLWEYTRFGGESPGPSASMPTRILSFTIDGAAFANAEPSVAAQWRAGNSLGISEIGPSDLDIEVDGQGHVVSLVQHGDLLVRWMPLSQPPRFTSPISS